MYSMSDMIITVNVLTEVIMSRLANIVVYEENKRILKNNGFYNDGKFIKLPHDLEKHRNVVYSHLMLLKILWRIRTNFLPGSLNTLQIVKSLL